MTGLVKILKGLTLLIREYILEVASCNQVDAQQQFQAIKSLVYKVKIHLEHSFQFMVIYQSLCPKYKHREYNYEFYLVV